MKSLSNHVSSLYKIEDNLWLGFYLQGKCGYIELAAYKKDGAKLNSIFPIDAFTIEQAVSKFREYID